MWVEDNNKEGIKISIRYDIESNITNLADVSNRIQDTIAALNSSVSGMPSGSDKKMIDDCQKSLYELSQVMQNLYACRNIIEQLNTKVWVDE